MDHERIAAQLAAALALLEGNRSRLERALNDTPDLDQHLVRMANDVAKASVDLSKEYRAWLKANRDAGQKLNLEERKQLTVQFLAKLNATDLQEVLDHVRTTRG